LLTYVHLHVKCTHANTLTHGRWKRSCPLLASSLHATKWSCTHTCPSASLLEPASVWCVGVFALCLRCVACPWLSLGSLPLLMCSEFSLCFLVHSHCDSQLLFQGLSNNQSCMLDLQLINRYFVSCYEDVVAKLTKGSHPWFAQSVRAGQ
jgi:hypothetical protein